MEICMFAKIKVVQIFDLHNFNTLIPVELRGVEPLSKQGTR